MFAALGWRTLRELIRERVDVEEEDMMRDKSQLMDGQTCAPTPPPFFAASVTQGSFQHGYHSSLQGEVKSDTVEQLHGD